MEIVAIFAALKDAKECDLWAVCYKEDEEHGQPIDIFSKLFKQWTDTSYLFQYLIDNAHELQSAYWQGKSPDNVIDQILDEALDFEQELKEIELGKTNYKFKDIVELLHKNEYQLRPKFKNLRKFKPNVYKPILRLYALELEDECFVISGGGIKLVEKMNDNDFLEKENEKLSRVQDYLKGEGISSKEGFL